MEEKDGFELEREAVEHLKKAHNCLVKAAIIQNNNRVTFSAGGRNKLLNSAVEINKLIALHR